MRLRNTQIELINSIVADSLGHDCSVFLFGSRKDDSARGGDVDLYIETPASIPLLKRARLQMRLENALGLPVDLLVKPRNATAKPFERMILEQAVPLQGSQAT